MSSDRWLHLGFLLREIEGGGDDAAKRCAARIRTVLSNDDEATRRDAIEAILALAPQPMPGAHYGASALLELGPAAAPALKRWILAHGKNGYSVVWATLHNRVDPRPGLAAFGELLEEADEALVAAAAAGVGAAGRAGAPYAARLRELSRSLGDSWLRGQAKAALGRVGASDRESLDLLVHGVREGDAEESLHAIIGLGLLGRAAADAVDAISTHLGSEEIFNACAAANALVRIGVRSQRVGDALAEALERERNPDRYLDFLRAIGELGVPSPRAKAALDAAAKSPDETMRSGARVAAYLAHGDPADLLDALSRRAGSGSVLWLLAEWRAPPGPFADSLMALAQERARTPPGQGGALADGTPQLFALLLRLGERAKRAIPALEKIAADEQEAPWTRDGAKAVIAQLRGE